MIEKELEIWLDKHGYEDAFEEDGLVITGKQDSNADTYTIQKSLINLLHKLNYEVAEIGFDSLGNPWASFKKVIFGERRGKLTGDGTDVKIGERPSAPKPNASSPSNMPGRELVRNGDEFWCKDCSAFYPCDCSNPERIPGLGRPYTTDSAEMVKES